MKYAFIPTIVLFLVASYGVSVSGSPPSSQPIFAGSADYRSKNWGLYNSLADSHIHIAEAWRIQGNARHVRVAVIDTGVDGHHPDLETFVETGRNFVGAGGGNIDEYGHGTHVAGIIRAVSGAKIIPFRYYSDGNPGSVNLRYSIRAIYSAIDAGAQIINYSGGGPDFSEAEYLAIKYAGERGILVVAAAGNEREDTDLPYNRFYPASYHLPNVIVVAAHDIQNERLHSSNVGRKSVDLFAPGENIFSTLSGGRYGYMSGTSMATPFVTGVAALILAKDPSLTPEQVKAIILHTVNVKRSLKGLCASGGTLNAHKALLLTSSSLRLRKEP